ncbi:hypothetical protein TSAR_005729 [Trichomalopsis sarcophagae]|uniref:G-protein coupled receptors family 1 profile domain-containing protein n=1 Tax=Trichomalopsis sarcophagae TaxID=543379 RepID=A0A232F060_9HYME|nr:hypothetical protein TSAR_005729 [Trichomalopsis sarcophagae]
MYETYAYEYAEAIAAVAKTNNSFANRLLTLSVAVVIAFFICWAPFHMQRLIAIYGKKNVYTLDRHYWMEQIYLILTYVSGVLYYVSTTINPILYNIMSNKFREAFMETLARSCRMSRFVMPRERRSYSSLSRSQQRNPATYPSRTTAISGGTALAQDSTDCSGNSFREEHQDLRAGANIAEYSSSETPPPLPPLIYGSSKQSSRKSVIAIEIGASDTSLSIMSVGNAPGQPRGSGNAGMGSHFVELNRQTGRNHSIGRELPSPGYDRCIRMTGSPARPLQRSSVVNCRSKPSQTANSKKKWWRLLDWLPGLKSIRTSRALTRPTQDNIIAELDQRLPKQPDDYFMQLHTFKAKDESCRPV